MLFSFFSRCLCSRLFTFTRKKKLFNSHAMAKRVPQKSLEKGTNRRICAKAHQCQGLLEREAHIDLPDQRCGKCRVVYWFFSGFIRFFLINIIIGSIGLLFFIRFFSSCSCFFLLIFGLLFCFCSVFLVCSFGFLLPPSYSFLFFFFCFLVVFLWKM